MTLFGVSTVVLLTSEKGAFKSIALHLDIHSLPVVLIFIVAGITALSVPNMWFWAAMWSLLGTRRCAAWLAIVIPAAATCKRHHGCNSQCDCRSYEFHYNHSL